MDWLRVYFSVQRNKQINSKHTGAGIDDVHKITWPFYKHFLFLHDNLVSCSTKTNMSKKTACLYSDDQKCLYQTEELAPSKKASRKFEELNNIQLNQLMSNYFNGQPKRKAETNSRF